MKTSRTVVGETPNGGVKSTVFFRAANGDATSEDLAVRAEIVEYDRDNNVIQRTHGQMKRSVNNAWTPVASNERMCWGKPCGEGDQSTSASVKVAATVVKLTRTVGAGIRAGLAKIVGALDADSHGGASLILGGRSAASVHQGLTQVVSSVFQCVHEEISDMAMSQHAGPGAGFMVRTAAKLAAHATAAAGKGLRKLTGNEIMELLNANPEGHNQYTVVKSEGVGKKPGKDEPHEVHEVSFGGVPIGKVQSYTDYKDTKSAGNKFATSRKEVLRWRLSLGEGHHKEVEEWSRKPLKGGYTEIGLGSKNEAMAKLKQLHGKTLTGNAATQESVADAEIIDLATGHALDALRQIRDASGEDMDLPTRARVRARVAAKLLGGNDDE